MDRGNRSAGKFTKARWLDYLRLTRAPMVCTALADVGMGFLFTRQTLAPWETFACLAAASACLYLSGMVLNDVYDLERDRQARPDRVLVAGRISPRRALWLGYALMLAGVACGWLASLLGLRISSLAWRSGLVATGLAAGVWLYDAVLKSSWAGPPVMGLCRLLNVLLGMSLAGSAGGHPTWAGFTPAQWAVASGIGTYVLGVTVYARREAAPNDRGPLLMGTGLIGLGILILAYFPRAVAAETTYYMGPHTITIWPLALLIVTLPLLRRCVAGIRKPHRAQVQQAVRLCLASIIVLDASICLLVCPWYWAVGLLALLVPMLVLARWIETT